MKAKKVFLGVIMVLALVPGALTAQEAGVGPWVKINEKDGIIAYARDNARHRSA